MNFSSEKSKKNIFQCLRSLFNMRKIIFCIERSLSVQISNRSTTLISTEVVIFCQYIKLQWGFFQLCELIFLTFSIYHNEICSLVKSNVIVINVKGYMIFDYMTNPYFCRDINPNWYLFLQEMVKFSQNHHHQMTYWDKGLFF